MKELKFRAWEIKKEIMHNNIQAIFLNKTKDKDIVCWTDPCGNDKPKDCLLRTDECKLMQFTGLKDKNGFDIYEGDICKHDEGKTFLVKWHDLHAEFTIDTIPMSSFSYNMIWFSRGATIIGNIHQNPKLLK